MGIAKTFTKDAQIDYLQCQNHWPNEECLQKNWDKYANIEFKGYSNNQKLEEAKNYFDAMAMYGAQHLIKDSGHQCNEITSWISIIFSSDYYAFCDSSKRYRLSPNGHNWRIISTSNMTSK